MKSLTEKAKRLFKGVGYWQILFFLIVVGLGIAMAAGWIESKPISNYR